MILITHSIIGSALTHRVAQVPAAFFAGLLSHYLADAIPHWHYPVPTIKKAVQAPYGERTLTIRTAPYREIVRVAIDVVIGLSLSLFLFSGSLEIIIAGVLGAILPDLMVGLSRFWPNPVLIAHERFHKWIHSTLMLDDRPLIGIGSQVALVAVFVFLFR